MNPFYYWFFRHYWWLLPAAFVATFCLPLATGVLQDPTHIVAWLGVHVALFYFVQKERIAAERITTLLLADFNNRYTPMEPVLRTVCDADTNLALAPEETDTLQTYFRLCCEQYDQYCRGYIPPQVWQSWLNGMRIYYYNARIRTLWDRHLERQTGYGFGRHLLK